MKFAQYLEDTQTSEWKKKYIDYRLLKKKISAIRQSYGSQRIVQSPVPAANSQGGTASETSVPNPLSTTASFNPTTSVGSIKSSPEHYLATDTPSPSLRLVPSNVSDNSQRTPLNRSQTLPAHISAQSRLERAQTPSLTRLFSFGNPRSSVKSSRFSKFVGPKPHPYSELPLNELIPLLSPAEAAFFSTLDDELEKVETFYLARENEFKVHTDLLELQLNELDQHRRLFKAAQSSGTRTTTINSSTIFKFRGNLLKEEHTISTAKDKGKAAVKKAAGIVPNSAASSNDHIPGDNLADSRTAQLDPEEFHSAKSQLKRAVLEHYRYILNITGIRKALKKFQKVTKIAAQNAYMTEKVEKSAFASEANVRLMMDKMENMYATRFAQGDRKRALTRLRSGPQHKNHHVSMFWSGLLVGLAVPAFVAGLYQSFRHRNSIPGGDGLLFVYGVFLIPVLFSVLVGFNILVWAHSRINYIFIFEFDVRTRLDHREYVLIPSLLLSTLCYAFWLSFAKLGAPSVSPTIWPMVWLGFTAIVMLDPLPVLFKPSRWWLLKNVAKLFASGTRRVEFCSLVFTLSNINLVVCLYAEGFSENWRNCGSASRLWPLSFVLAILPFLIRVVQSIKRYVDSGLDTHLINAGKYAAGIVSYFCYFIWRHQGGHSHGGSFVVWVFFQTVYTLYALSWDFVMDWSILRLDVHYPLLRGELVYSNHIYNEHLGNVDQYRVTREVPLPYSLDEPRGNDVDDEEGSSPTTWLPQRAIPEWKRAYIDYRIFKERIRAIRRAQDGMTLPVGSYSNTALPQYNPAGSALSVITSESGEMSSEASSDRLPGPYTLSPPHAPSRGNTLPEPSSRQLPHGPHNDVMPATPEPGALIDRKPQPKPQLLIPTIVIQSAEHSSLAAPSPVVETGTLNNGHLSPKIQRPILATRPSNFTGRSHPRVPPSPSLSLKCRKTAVEPLMRHPYSSLSLHSLLPLLSPQELAFFTALESELDKVETFYLTRKTEMEARTKGLEAQLRELTEHRKLFEVCLCSSIDLRSGQCILLELSPTAIFRRWLSFATAWIKNSGDVAQDAVSVDAESALKRDEDRIEIGPFPDHLDPGAYWHARHKLKKAVLEHYRGLEMLHNYRILNIYGFRRVLSKFEKATKIQVQRVYVEEKMAKCSFFQDETLRTTMNEMQNIFASSFAEGDRKKALTRLRAGPQYKSHHNSAFCSGLAIGSAMAALGLGIRHIFETDTRNNIPGWDGLLFIYGVLAVPTFFAVLVGLNILVWARARINYVFIFELDLRTRLDHREYFQTPCILLATLCYAFWLSFARIGAPAVNPTIWPLVWLAFAVLVMLDPLPILYKPSRYWLIRNVGKLLKSGLKRVEFTDFWMGDQFCSLVFTLSNLTLIGCVYSQGLNLSPDWRKCGSASNLWPLSFVLATLPFLVRLVQSFRRYADSKLRTHLINAGKYGAGIINYLCYFIWRHRGGQYDTAFVFWCLFNTFYTIYAMTWDLLMDWSFMQRHSRHFLLRQELVYTNHIFMYYFAIVTNALIRFMWIFYIPVKGPDAMLRTFIVGLLEVVRRWQWNFYRLENEHLGNVDQYRVTREVPFPYDIPFEVRGELDEEIPEKAPWTGAPR
ncbi:signal transduction protein [Favolaschia claudopus]|uniref:Signal transduction protein n=1 Tax=Favolaschia claudopus TaxID=2862362 RepID=A0AAW0AKY0_9AGAR